MIDDAGVAVSAMRQPPSGCGVTRDFSSFQSTGDRGRPSVARAISQWVSKMALMARVEAARASGVSAFASRAAEACRDTARRRTHRHSARTTASCRHAALAPQRPRQPEHHQVELQILPTELEGSFDSITRRKKSGKPPSCTTKSTLADRCRPESRRRR